MNKNLLIAASAFLISCSVSPKHAEVIARFGNINFTDGIDKTEAISMAHYFLYQTYQERNYYISKPDIKDGVDNQEWVIGFMPFLRPLILPTPLIVMINKKTGEFKNTVFTPNGNKIDVSIETIDLKSLK